MFVFVCVCMCVCVFVCVCVRACVRWALARRRVRAFNQVPHALAAAEARGPGNGFDAILMDVNMARVNGDVACAALRAAGCALPVIAVSGTADDPEYVRRCGFTGVLSKPFSLEQLREALVAHIPAAADAECPTSCQ